HQYKGKQISFNWVKEQAIKNNDKNGINALSNITFPDSLANSDIWMDYLMVERNYVTQYGGGLTHKTRGIWPIIEILLHT
nr:hypothetical protein [Bacteroidota bacterium]